MSDVLRLTAADLGEKIAARELTAVAVARLTCQLPLASTVTS